MKALNIQLSTLGQFFLANYGMWRHYFLVGYYNFKVYVPFSLLRTEQFCHPKKVCHLPNIQNIYYKKFQIEEKMYQLLGKN
jgi:hypothetical protein